MSLYAELQRRNVIRLAGLYLVGAWLLVQVASTLFPAFGVPGWALRALVIALALGFVPALVIAWVFELTPDGFKRDDEVVPDRALAADTAQRMNRLIVVVLLLAVGYFCVDKFALAPRRDAALVVSTAQAARSEIRTEQRKQALANSIAVLPFVNMSDDKGNQFFSDGISEELLNVLVRVDGLSVASRTSSFAYRDKAMGTQAIGRELNVSHVLEGSVRKAGNTVRITAQLIDTANDRHVWSKTYDRELTDIFAIQDEIAQAIVDALRGTMAAQARAVVQVRADTENMQAYELYLKARENFLARRDLAATVAMFERVVQLDPNFARGWESLAAASVVAPSWGLRDRDYLALAGQAAERALQLDPSLSMPWAAQAQLAHERWPIDYAGVLGKLDKAIAADPKNATAWLWRGIAWQDLGFFQRSLADIERCLALEPRYANCTRFKALNLLFLGREDQALGLFEQGLAADGPGSRAQLFVAPVLARGDRTGALLLLQDLPPEWRQLVLQALEHPQAPGAALQARLARYAAAAGADDATSAVRVAFWLGDYSRLDSLDTSGTPTVVAWERYPASFRNSPAMKLRLEKMGVAAYWRGHGVAPGCRAGAGGFSCD